MLMADAGRVTRERNLARAEVEGLRAQVRGRGGGASGIGASLLACWWVLRAPTLGRLPACCCTRPLAPLTANLSACPCPCLPPPQVAQLREELGRGLLSPDEMAEHARALEQLSTLRESNAHLRAQNRELADTAARREREAGEARAQLQPLRDQIT
jgi:hypothetical protein